MIRETKIVSVRVIFLGNFLALSLVVFVMREGTTSLSLSSRKKSGFELPELPKILLFTMSQCEREKKFFKRQN